MRAASTRGHGPLPVSVDARGAKDADSRLVSRPVLGLTN
jgi:hypothetical protein